LSRGAGGGCLPSVAHELWGTGSANETATVTYNCGQSAATDTFKLKSTFPYDSRSSKLAAAHPAEASHDTGADGHRYPSSKSSTFQFAPGAALCCPTVADKQPRGDVRTVWVQREPCGCAGSHDDDSWQIATGTHWHQQRAQVSAREAAEQRHMSPPVSCDFCID
jgi:hypothetical protein